MARFERKRPLRRPDQVIGRARNLKEMNMFLKIHKFPIKDVKFIFRGRGGGDNGYLITFKEPIVIPRTLSY